MRTYFVKKIKFQYQNQIQSLAQMKQIRDKQRSDMRARDKGSSISNMKT